MSKLNKRRRLWPVVGAVVVVNAAGVWALSGAAQTRDDLHADQVSVRWEAPTIAAPVADDADEGSVGAGTPAATFVADLAQMPAAALFGEGFLTAALTRSEPATPPCMEWPEAMPAVTLTPSRSAGNGLTAQILTTPAGAGTADRKSVV